MLVQQIFRGRQGFVGPVPGGDCEHRQSDLTSWRPTQSPHKETKRSNKVEDIDIKARKLEYDIFFSNNTYHNRAESVSSC